MLQHFTPLRAVIVSAILMLILTTLFYPYGYDQTVFSIGGEMLLRHGAVPFRDFLDTKPPLIFLIYGIASFLFGHHEWSIRLLDALYHIGSLYYFYRLLVRTTSNENVAFGSVTMYAALYFVSTFIMVGQVESFALLPTLILYDISERTGQHSRPIGRGIIAGICTTILIALKPTFIVIPIASVVYLFLFNRAGSLKGTLLFLGGSLIGFIFSFGGILLYLNTIGVLPQAGEWLHWVQGYSKISDQSLQEGSYRIFPIGLMTAFGISTIIIGALGGFLVSKFSPRSSTFTHLAIQFTFGCATVLLERKYFPYHYIRLYWSAVPFIYIGYRELSNRWHSSLFSESNIGIVRKLIIFSGGLIIILYSFIPRVLVHPIHWISARLSGGDYAADVQIQYPSLVYKDQVMVSDWLQPLLQPSDEIYIWGHNVGVYYWLNRYRSPYGIPNAPYVTSWSPNHWRSELLASLTKNPPRFFVCEFGDIRTYITGDTLDSYQYLQQWSELNTFVTQQYLPRQTIGHFQIFERTK